MLTVLLTVTGPPSNGGTLADRNADAMQPPVAVPWKGGPCTFADVTRPEGANVTLTLAEPLGSPSCLHPRAAPETALSAALATPGSNCAPACCVSRLGPATFV